MKSILYKISGLFPWLTLAALLAGCANTDTAVFVTKSSLSILDADTTPANVSVAYDRTEGFFGPAYDTGGAPQVVGIMETDGTIFNPQIKQLYATGDAALIIAGSPDPDEQPKLSGKKRMMFFGTSTSLGFKVMFKADAPLPTGLTLGYKRKEVSVIPLGRGTGGHNEPEEKYPSVFASIESTPSTRQRSSAGLKLAQVFATGEAADSMASSMRSNFKARVEESIGAAQTMATEQRKVAGEIIQTYADLDPSKRAAAWENADQLALFHETKEEKGTTLSYLRSAPDERADVYYATVIGTPNVSDPARASLLNLHLNAIQKLPRRQ